MIFATRHTQVVQCYKDLYDGMSATGLRGVYCLALCFRSCPANIIPGQSGWDFALFEILTGTRMVRFYRVLLKVTPMCDVPCPESLSRRVQFNAGSDQCINTTNWVLTSVVSVIHTKGDSNEWPKQT